MRFLAFLRFSIIASILLLGVTPAFASETQGTISDTSKYAWGENIGWINFAPAQGELYRGLLITDSTVTGYAWSPNFGWVNFNPTNSGQGVTNTSNGVLGGSAWIQNVGWLPMSGVTIDTHGVFHGIAGAASTTVGRVSFDCDKCTVTTDWRPLSARTSNDIAPPAPPAPAAPAPAGGNGPVVLAQQVSRSQAQVVQKVANQPSADTSGGVSGPDVTVTPAVESSAAHFQEQSGEYRATVDVPSGASDGSLRISVQQKAVVTGSDELVGMNPSLRVVGSTYFDITAVSSTGQEVHSFKKPIKITLALPKGLIGLDTSELEVCWYDTVHGVWIPVPNTVFSASTVSFFVDHLTRFAILRILPPSATSTPTTAPVTKSYGNWQNLPIGFLLLVVLVVGLAIYSRRRRDS